MAAVSYYLSGSSGWYQRVAEEIRTTFSSVDEIRLGPKLNSCVTLRACIDEAMRLSPPGGSSLWREVEKGGALIGGDFIPKGCEVGVGVYAIHHHPDYWEEPFSFKPERWLKEAARQTDAKQAYAPFNIGPRSCVGKPLVCIPGYPYPYPSFFFFFCFGFIASAPLLWHINPLLNDANF